MSKNKKLEVEVVDDDLLKLLLDKISVLQSQVSCLQVQVQQLEIRVEYPQIFSAKLNVDGVAQ